jgi:hypothetical protein
VSVKIAVTAVAPRLDGTSRMPVDPRLLTVSAVVLFTGAARSGNKTVLRAIILLRPLPSSDNELHGQTTDR